MPERTLRIREEILKGCTLCTEFWRKIDLAVCCSRVRLSITKTKTKQMTTP